MNVKAADGSFFNTHEEANVYNEKFGPLSIDMGSNFMVTVMQKRGPIALKWRLEYHSSESPVYGPWTDYEDGTCLALGGKQYLIWTNPDPSILPNGIKPNVIYTANLSPIQY